MGGDPPVLFESESLPRDSEKGEGKRKGPSKSSGGDFGEDGFDAERGGYNIAGTLCARDYKGVSNKSPFDRKVVIEKNNAETKTIVDDVVSWNERDRMSNPKLNVTDPIVSTAYKGSNLVGYFGDCDVFSIEGNGQRPSHRGAGINDNGVQYTLNTTEVHAVAYKKEDE